MRERIENTAQILCEHAWKPIVAEWTKKYRRVAPDSSPTTKRSKLVSLSDSSGGVRNQHYSPVFANEFWASHEPGRKVRVYTRGLDLEIVSKDKGYSRWACEKFLYSQKLEKHFHLIEGDARRPYQRLLDTIPLTEMDRRHWIAYLIAQIYRTPRGVRWQVNGLKRIITERRWSYSTNVGSLRAAYETLFTASPVFAFYYRLFDRLEWHMLRATAGTHFLRSDEPVVMGGSIDGGTWQLLYPMTPQRCFVLGTRDAEERKRIVPSGRELTTDEMYALNARIARSARESVIGLTVEDDAATKALLRANLSLVEYERFNLEDSLLKFWG